MLISELGYMHYTESKEEREGEGWGQEAKSCLLVLHFPRSSAWKQQSFTNAFFSIYVIISLNIISVLQPTAAWFKGSLVSWPRARITYTHTHAHTHTATLLSSFLFSHRLAPSFSLTPAQSSSASIAPGWLITGRSNIFEFSGELSHTIPASGSMCYPALLFSLLQTAMIQMEF